MTNADFGALNAANLTSVWAHWFFYGPSGAGKTELASTFPRPLFIVPQNEMSIVTLRGREIPYFVVTDMDKDKTAIRNGMGSMMAIINRLEHWYSKDPSKFPFDTIVCDGTTHYLDLVQEQITNGGVKIMAQNDWGTLSSHMRTVQNRLRKLEVHAVWIALDKTEQSDDGKALFGSPHLPGQLATKFPSSCDVLGYQEVIVGKDGPIYRTHFERHRHYPARTRFSRLPRVVDYFDFNNIAHALDPDELQQASE